MFPLRKINLLPLTYSHFHTRTFLHANYFSSFSLLEQQHGSLLTRLLSAAILFFSCPLQSACWWAHQYYQDVGVSSTHSHSLPIPRADLDLKTNTKACDEALDEPALPTQDKCLSLALGTVCKVCAVTLGCG